jgi:hypothetical protein
MTTLRLSLITAAFLSSAVLAQAQSTPSGPPPNSIKLSDIVARVEKRPGFQFIERIVWFNDAYIVTFYTSEKARVEMHFDAVTGQPK